MWQSEREAPPVAVVSRGEVDEEAGWTKKVVSMHRAVGAVFLKANPNLWPGLGSELMEAASSVQNSHTRYVHERGGQKQKNG